MLRIVLSLAVLVVLSSATLSAAIVSCESIANLSQLIADPPSADNGCLEGDKLFTNWSYEGDTAAGEVEVEIETILDSLHSVAFGGPWTTTFQINYTISVAPGNPAFINNVGMDINAPNTGGGANTSSATKTLTLNSGGQVILVADNNSPSPSAAVNATSIGVQLNGSPESGTEPLVSVSDSYTQAIIPEPGTYGLLGAGLLSLAILGRRKR